MDRENPDITVKRQCELLGIPRSSYYAERKPQGFTEEEERAMKIMDAAHVENSYYGSRSHMKNLAKSGIRFGRHHVARLMEHMGIRSTAPQPKTSTPAKNHPKIPYLLRGLPIRFKVADFFGQLKQDSKRDLLASEVGSQPLLSK